MIKDKALKRAIDLLECPQITEERINVVVNACKEALEQPAQEPVAWMYEWEDEKTVKLTFHPDSIAKTIPLYTHPHQDGTSPSGARDKEFVTLTDDEIDMLWLSNETTDDGAGEHLTYARAIEQALKEKNHG